MPTKTITRSDDDDPLRSPQEVSRQIGTGVEHARGKMLRGEFGPLTDVGDGNRAYWRVRQSAVTRWIESRTVSK